MNYRLAKQYDYAKPTALRETFKLAAQPGVISLAAGTPNPATFPYKELAAVAAQVLSTQERAEEALKYGISEGYNPLRQYLAKRMSEKYGVGIYGDSLLITSGGQQGIELCAKIFLNAGDGVVVESPTFVNSISTFRGFTGNIHAVDMEADGMCLGHLEATLQADRSIKLIYTIPTFQNPTGYTTSLEKRKGIYELARKYNAIILEDDPYFELRYDGAHIPAIKSLDVDGRVIYTSSLSKLLAPGLRLGYVIVPEGVSDKFTAAKGCEDVHTNLLVQHLAAEYLSQYELDAHIEGIRELYRKKRDLMLQALDTALGAEVEWLRPEGGIFLWCKLPEGYDCEALFDLAFQRHKLLISAGTGFYAQGDGPCRAFRLNFSYPTDSMISTGVGLLAESVKELLAR